MRSVHAHREVDDDLVLRLSEDLGDVPIDLDQRHRLLDLLGGDREQVATLLEGGRVTAP